MYKLQQEALAPLFSHLTQRRRVMRKLLLLVCVVALFSPAWALAQNPPKQDTVNITGTWDLQFDMEGMGPMTITATYKQEGEKLTGSHSGPDGGTSPLEGTVVGNAVKYTVTFDMGGQPGKAEHTATVEGDTMKGKFDIAGMMSGPFTGKKRQ
jgi:hypothetical protein